MLNTVPTTPGAPVRSAAAVSDASSALPNIDNFVVLMLENRSFDHLVGSLRAVDPRIAGIAGTETNPEDPATPGSPEVPVARATSFVMPFDPGHEFPDVQTQLYAPSAAPVDPAAMRGFVASANHAAEFDGDEKRIMECFQPDQVPVLSALVREFSLFNFWHSSLPGPTWPNRFFIHAATSGGLTDSPDTDDIVGGYDFTTIYDRLAGAGKDWRIYHDGLPQSAGINGLRLEYVNPLTKHFRGMNFFDGDVAGGALPEYTFIEPNYDTGHNYQNGNSMHPLNDIRQGERLVKQVYETLRKSAYWKKLMLIITFDEHGGFYDHVPPPPGTPTGDDTRFATAERNFNFDRLGVRVPAIVVSPYTARGTIIGDNPDNPATRFDHTSVLATVENRFNLKPLTRRDAQAQRLDVTLNAPAPRLDPGDAPLKLPDPPVDAGAGSPAPVAVVQPLAATEQGPLSNNQRSLVSLALACDLQVRDPAQHAAARERHARIKTQRDAADYISEVETKIHSRRRPGGPPRRTS